MNDNKDDIMKKALNMEDFKFFLLYALGPLKKDVDKLQNMEGIHIGESEPEKTDELWIDTANGGAAKYYDGEKWVTNTAVIGSKPSNVVGAMWFE